MPDGKRIAITGMSINTPLGDKLEDFLDSLLQGRSAITRWRFFDSSGIDSKIGGDLSEYDIARKVSSLCQQIPEAVAERLQRLIGSSPWSTKLSILLAVDAFLDGGFFAGFMDHERAAAIISGHNFNDMYMYGNYRRFAVAADEIDTTLALQSLDSDHAGCVAEALDIRGPAYTVGGACASGNMAMRCAMDEIRQHNMEAVLIVAPVYDICPPVLHSLAMMGAIPADRFNDNPAMASRPFDISRQGFVPSHGGGALILEAWEHALKRGARIYGELLGVEMNSGASRTPRPSEEHEARVMERVLRNTGIDPEMIDYVSAHATSTRLGDLAEVGALRRVFGDHARVLKVNATKSMIGHTCWSSAVVETVAAILQMKAGHLHPSINIERLDTGIDMDVCANGVVKHTVKYLLKLAFGFGGMNSASIIRRHDG